MADHSGILNAADGDNNAAIDIDFLALLAVGVDGQLGRTGADGIDQATVDVEIAVGVETVIVGGTRINVATANGHILSRVNTVIVGVDINLATGDVEIVLTLDALAVFAGGGHLHLAATDDHTASVGVAVAVLNLKTSLDAFGRRVEVAADVVGVAGIVSVLGGAIIIVKAAAGGDCDVAAADGEDAVALHTLAARAGSSEREGAAADVDVAVGADAAGRLGLLVVGVPGAIATGGDIDDRITADEDVANTLYAFGGNGGAVDGDVATADIDISAVLVLVVFGLTRRGVAVEVALDAIVARAADVDGAALHQEILVAGDAVTHGGGDVESGVLDGDVLASLDGVLHVAHHVERALLLELGVALHVEAALLRAGGGIDECVGGAGDDLHVDAFAVLDMHRSAAVDRRSVGQRQAVELDGGLVGARHVEAAIRRRTAEVVGNLAGKIASLRDGDVSPLLGDGQILHHTAVYRYSGGVAIVDHRNLRPRNATGSEGNKEE